MHRAAVISALRQSLFPRNVCPLLSLKAQEATLAAETTQVSSQESRRPSVKKEKAAVKEEIKTLIGKLGVKEINPQDAKKTITELKTLVESSRLELVYASTKQLSLLLSLFVQHVDEFTLMSVASMVNFLYSSECKFDEQSETAIRTSITDRLPRASVYKILQLVDFLRVRGKNKLELQILEPAVSAVQKRWVEVKRPVDLIRVFQNSKRFDDKFLSRMEEMIVEQSENATTEEKIMLFSSLKAAQRRPTPALRALAYHLSKAVDKLTLKQCMDLFYDITALSLYDPALIERVCIDAVQSFDVKKTTPAQVSRIATSLGMLKYRHKELLEQIADWCIANPSLLDSRTFLPVVVTFAVLDFQPLSFDIFSKLARQKLTQSSVSSLSNWVDAVWSMVILEVAKIEDVQSVLDPVQIAKLSKNGKLGAATKVKLEELANYAEILGCGKTELDLSFLPETIRRPMDYKSALSTSVTDALANFIPKPKFLRVGSTPLPGVLVDAECILNRQFVPLDLEEYNPSNPRCLPLPQDASRIAVIVQAYRDLCLGSSHPVGIQSLQRRLLESKGYKVVTIPYSEFSVQSKLQTKLKYLEQKLKLACDFNIQKL